jgi:alpha-glucosidase (family GH31 glycosyl hydrolase)
MSCFGASLFRTHMGLSISNRNAQIYQSPRLLTHFNLFSVLFKELKVYRRELMVQASAKGWPVMRSMAAHYPNDPLCWTLTSQYMFGPDFLVAPVLDSVKNSLDKATVYARNAEEFKEVAVSSVKVYLPAGAGVWVHLWSGQEIENTQEGRYVSIDAPIGGIPVLFVKDSVAGQRLRETVVKMHMQIITVFLLQQQDGQGQGAMMGEIREYVARDWFDWLGVKQYMTI